MDMSKTCSSNFFNPFPRLDIHFLKLSGLIIFYQKTQPQEATTTELQESTQSNNILLKNFTGTDRKGRSDHKQSTVKK